MSKIPSRQLPFWDEQRETDTDPETKEEKWLQSYLDSANLANLPCEYENWQIKESIAQLSYLSHGFFRYFGKFPPPVARRFIEGLHEPSVGPVIDPMMGSGTTLVEAILLKRSAIGMDVNPLACIVSKE